MLQPPCHSPGPPTVCRARNSAESPRATPSPGSRPNPCPPYHLAGTVLQSGGLPEAWRCFLSQSPSQALVGLDFSSNQKSIIKQWLWNARHSQCIWSLVTMKITPAGRRGSFYRCPTTQECPDPCAKETMTDGSQPMQERKKGSLLDHTGCRPWTPSEGGRAQSAGSLL